MQLQLIMLNPQWLRTFAALAELGNFTRAAERLDLTQAAVSQHLHHLEDALGLLVIRRPRAIELSTQALKHSSTQALEHSSTRALKHRSQENFCNPGAGSSSGAEKANLARTNPFDADVGKRQSAYNRNISIHHLRFETFVDAGQCLCRN
ncbi:hypothetical protein NK8_57450 (plasmid) [Caballeronia sp. NK8]|nr:hypothetical protein NK8_57450 [Caballeronia sp. NK8]